jgi:hypothetical protein
LVYVGQGRLAARLRAHLAKGAIVGHRQAEHLSAELEVSWVGVPDVPTVQLLEHENDLIAAHVVATGRSPTAQFLG